MRTILLTAPYRGKALEQVEKLLPDGFGLRVLEESSQEELYEKAYLAEYILASENLKIDGRVIENAPRLKMVQRMGTGRDSLDLAALKERGIPAYINFGVNAESVAEHTVMFILAILRKLPVVSERTKQGIWEKREQGIQLRTLSSQTVGLLGLGNIGTKVAALLKPFGCRVIYYSPHRKREAECAYGLEYVDFQSLLQQSDILSLHCQLNDETRNIICKENLRKAKQGLKIVNTARGALVHEQDLLEALDSGVVDAAALDVYCSEPYINMALASHEKVICSPHVAGNTFDAFSEMARQAFFNIVCFEKCELDKIEKFKICD